MKCFCSHNKNRANGSTKQIKVEFWCNKRFFRHFFSQIALDRNNRGTISQRPKIRFQQCGKSCFCFHLQIRRSVHYFCARALISQCIDIVESTRFSTQSFADDILIIKNNQWAGAPALPANEISIAVKILTDLFFVCFSYLWGGTDFRRVGTRQTF